MSDLFRAALWWAAVSLATLTTSGQRLCIPFSEPIWGYFSENSLRTPDDLVVIFSGVFEVDQHISENSLRTPRRSSSDLL